VVCNGTKGVAFVLATRVVCTGVKAIVLKSTHVGA
jgi:hypothetical protein